MGRETAPKTPFEVRRRALLGFRQEQALSFLREREEAGLSRTLSEISEALGLDGKGHAWNVVHRLSERGLTYRDENGQLRTRTT